MKTNIKSLELIEKGLSAKIVSKLNEGQINILHKRLIGEETKKTVTSVTYDPANQPDQEKLAKLGVHVDPASKKITMTQSGGDITTEEEMTEDETDDVTDDSALGADALQAYTGQRAPHMANNMGPDGMDDDSDDDRQMMGMSESKKSKKNPWAICTAQLGGEFGTRERHLWSAKEKNKYERCVKDVKKSLKEGKNPLSLFLENEITKIVERNIPPQITKKDLMKYLNEAEPTTKPKKPITKPDTRPKPKHPGQNPNPGEKEAPKAKRPNVSPEQAKDKVIDAIMNLLKK
mgnify:CR=1 FL=1